MLDFLACPVDKAYPLELHELSSDERNVSFGVLVCPQCSRYYPIIESIPVMFPDSLRNQEKDVQFLENWRHKLPDKIIKEGKPWHL